MFYKHNILITRRFLLLFNYKELIPIRNNNNTIKKHLRRVSAYIVIQTIFTYG